ncbi:hypothetical protein DUPY_41480 [Duganella phyllosphaerae]|uniref:Uncharacterized protein n=1 Tax=Duganella phyllosphaerae TaxID=762836 RepID=A0A1E7WDH1_9BURK|nr:hypothetical protein DUPY_41480 [Duganella phyllosphaerae]
MISMARRLGAPVIEPHGYNASNTCASVASVRKVAVMVEVICSTLP